MAVCRSFGGRIYEWLRRARWVDNLEKKCVFITGCDSGFGYTLAKSLCGYGLHVYAGCLTPSGGETLRRDAGPRLTPLIVDVTNTNSVVRAADYVTQTLPKDTVLWGIVNNAGILGHTGPVEFLTKEDFKEVFEVNLYGMVDVTKAFLPLLKQSQGRIVNMASIAGTISFPNWTPYMSSKHAAKGYSDSLRLEKDVWGIKVATIQPGFMKTNLFNTGVMGTKTKQKWDSLNPSIQAEYGEEYVIQSQQWTEQLLAKEMSTSHYKVIHAYEHALLAKRPKGVYYPGFGAKSMLSVKTLPQIVWDTYVLSQLKVFPKNSKKG